ncbi:hypothetical protein PILCRDRAFT_816027 [Piloderma croceum F 1598]|uniref:Uncharacterized protein n=1 Tax=Piloderma croceum (strain F 1598) TaxID=765440 RepID=A0A0C3G7Z0_PILCF|nr:hypothetical protein PILCRDRAFT_816027 [Piloderma croceum F 1598]
MHIHYSPDPKSFISFATIENGDIIFGIIEKKTVGTSQGSKWSTSGYSIMIYRYGRHHSGSEKNGLHHR